ncbi:hypothetical protein [Mesorhizobium sp. ORS 3428]|uniref:hypothetical protein n=1 Tax=Mesorhizobium sp. ORS 3428 TaxID=540997 RepID=UPI0010421B59|nr:hypothetical protein [Mesorhizobium sp. ORS 3428]
MDKLTSAEIRTRLQANEQRLAELREERRPVALASLSGDKAASKEIARITAEESALRSEIDTLEVAAEHAERLEAEEAQRAAKEDRQKRETEARRLAALLIENSQRFDALAGEMTAVLRRRRELARQIWGTGTVTDAYVNTSHRPYIVASAMAAAGLADFDVVNTTGTRRRPLAEADTGFYGRIGGEPLPAPSLPDAENETLEAAGI